MADKLTPEEKELLYKIQSRNGKKGGDVTLRKYGVTHFSNASKKRWEVKK